MQGAIPPFYIPGTGFTRLRQAVQLSGTALFLLAGLLLVWRYLQSRNTFLYWYSQGVLLLGIGLATRMLAAAPNDLVQWLGRLDTYVGGMFIIVAVAGAAREARTRHVPVAQVIAAFFRQTRESYQRVADSAGTAAGVSPGGMTAGKRLGVAIPLLLLLSLFLSRAVDITFVYYPVISFWGLDVTLFSVFSIIFVTLISLAVALLAGRSFTATGRWHLAWVGGGALLFGFSSLLAALAQTRINASATIHNTGSLLAGVSYVTSALYAWSARPLPLQRKARVPVLTGIYGGGALLMLLITLLSLRGLTPTFFIPGIGSTLVREMVLGSAYVLFALSGVLLLLLYFRSRAGFLYWYAMGLVLITP